MYHDLVYFTGIGERYGVLSDCEELWGRQIAETLIIEVAFMHKRD